MTKDNEMKKIEPENLIVLAVLLILICAVFVDIYKNNKTQDALMKFYGWGADQSAVLEKRTSNCLNSHEQLKDFSNNFAVGQNAGYSLTTGSCNWLFGKDAGKNLNTESNQLIITLPDGREYLHCDMKKKKCSFMKDEITP